MFGQSIECVNKKLKPTNPTVLFLGPYERQGMIHMEYLQPCEIWFCHAGDTHGFALDLYIVLHTVNYEVPRFGFWVQPARE